MGNALARIFAPGALILLLMYFYTGLPVTSSWRILLSALITIAALVMLGRVYNYFNGPSEYFYERHTEFMAIQLGEPVCVVTVLDLREEFTSTVVFHAINHLSCIYTETVKSASGRVILRQIVLELPPFIEEDYCHLSDYHAPVEENV